MGSGANAERFGQIFARRRALTARVSGNRFVRASGMDQRVRWAIYEMQRRIGEPLSIAQLAAGANLSPSRFNHLFRDATGCSPARYLREVRLEHARLLLESTFLIVKEVRARVGINDA